MADRKQCGIAKKKKIRIFTASSGGVIVSIIIIILAIMFLPVLARYRALLVMSAYDRYCEQTSVPRALSLSVELPYKVSEEDLQSAGSDIPAKDMKYLPLLISFNDDAGMSYFLERDVRFTVDYAVADFPLFGKHSHFYEPQHPLYNSYIGAYYLTGYGKEANDEDTALHLAKSIAEFDQTALALPALGLASPDAVFNVIETIKEESLLHEGLIWSSYTATIETNGGEHEPAAFLQSYLQFGKSPGGVNYPLRLMKGQFYFTYIEEKDLFLGLYALLSDEEVLELVDRYILRQATIKFNEEY